MLTVFQRCWLLKCSQSTSTSYVCFLGGLFRTYFWELIFRTSFRILRYCWFLEFFKKMYMFIKINCYTDHRRWSEKISPHKRGPKKTQKKTLFIMAMYPGWCWPGGKCRKHSTGQHQLAKTSRKVQFSLFFVTLFRLYLSTGQHWWSNWRLHFSLTTSKWTFHRTPNLWTAIQI